MLTFTRYVILLKFSPNLKLCLATSTHNLNNSDLIG